MAATYMRVCMYRTCVIVLYKRVRVYIESRHPLWFDLYLTIIYLFFRTIYIDGDASGRSI